jgi:hypothetical protein
MAATPQPDHPSSLEERLSQLERLLQTQAERMAAQEAEISAQREEIARLRTPTTPRIAMPLSIPPALPVVEPAPGGDAAERPADRRRQSRRALLKLGGAAGVAAVAAGATELAHPGTAHANGLTW